MTRWRAAGMHALLSALVALPVCLCVAFVWYPAPLFGVAGGARLLALFLLTLFASGPLLTLVLYRQGKRGMLFDLWMIAALQSAALGYNVYVLLDSRPVYIAVLPMRATLVRANELHRDPPAAPGFERAPLWGPEYVGVVDPPSEAAKQAVFQQVLSGLPDIDQRPAYYRDIEDRLPDLVLHAESLSERIAREPSSRPHYVRWLRRHGYDGPEGLRYYPLIASHGELELVLDERRKTIVGIAPLPH